MCKKVIINCDGSISGGNPGGWAVGGWVAKSEGIVIGRGVFDLGKQSKNTNNQAEYAAVWDAVVWALGQAHEEVLIRTDSQLVVNQLQKNWACNKEELKEWRDSILRMVPNFTHLQFEWVPRAENSDADEQSRTLYCDDNLRKSYGL